MCRQYAELLLALSLLLQAGCSSMPGERQPATQLQAITPALQANYLEAITLLQEHEWLAAQQRLLPITVSHPQLSGPWLNLGITRLQLGDGSAAEAAFNRALEANPGNIEACNQLGILYRRAGRLDEARRYYEAALLHDPDYADAHWNLGILHDQYLSNPQLALQHYERYQAITGSTDPQLQAWIAELRLHNRAETITAKVQP
jgi:tetratricopeptide (TPR) repeat protein